MINIYLSNRVNDTHSDGISEIDSVWFIKSRLPLFAGAFLPGGIHVTIYNTPQTTQGLQ